ncbi:MAG: AI-2E family transporter [Elainellaceae cyanobacterium]
MKLDSQQQVSISLSTLLTAASFVLAVVLLWQLRSLLLLLLIATVLASAISPIVNWAEQWRIPRWVTVILVYSTLIGGLTGFIILIGPSLFDQIQRLIRQVPLSISNALVTIEGWAARQNDTRPDLVSDVFNQIIDVQGLTTWAIRSTQQLLRRSVSITTGLVGGVFSVVLAIFISGYMVSDSRKLIRGLVSLLPQPWDERLAAQMTPISNRIGSYVRGRILVSAVLGVIITTTLRFLGLSDFALGLGAIAGITNLIPFIGPFLGAIPALTIAISQGWWTLLWVAVLFAVVQNLETYVLDPLLVGSSVGVHPLYQLLAVLGGTQVLGIIGAIIVPPWIAGAAVLVENLYLQPKLLMEKRTARTRRIQAKAPVTSG